MPTTVRSPWSTGSAQRVGDGMSPGAFANPSSRNYWRSGRRRRLPAAPNRPSARNGSVRRLPRSWVKARRDRRSETVMAEGDLPARGGHIARHIGKGGLTPVRLLPDRGRPKPLGNAPARVQAAARPLPDRRR
jgi:hypothetical protein